MSGNSHDKMNKAFKYISNFAVVLTVICSFGYLAQKLNILNLNIENHVIIILSSFFAFVFPCFYLWNFLQKKRSGDLDHFCEYTIKVINKEGDTLIKRTAEISILRRIPYIKNISLYSDGNPMNFNQINFTAYDDDSRKIFFKTKVDQPTLKRIDLFFDKKDYYRRKFVYTYQYYWKKLLPKNEDYFFLQDTAPIQEINLIIPKNWELEYIQVEEYDPAGNIQRVPCYEKSTRIEKNIIIRKYSVQKFKRNNKIKFSWKINK